LLLVIYYIHRPTDKNIIKEVSENRKVSAGKISNIIDTNIKNKLTLFFVDLEQEYRNIQIRQSVKYKNN
jgi:hypothetical protein